MASEEIPGHKPQTEVEEAVAEAEVTALRIKRRKDRKLRNNPPRKRTRSLLLAKLQTNIS